MKQHQYARLCLAIKNTHPEVYNETMGKMDATLRNTDLIPALYEFYLEQFPVAEGASRNEQSTHELVFISSVLYLYCPSALFLNLRVTDRICTIMQRLMGYNNRQSISEKVGNARAYVKIKSFMERVHQVSESLHGHSRSLAGSMLIQGQNSHQYSFGF